MKILISYIKRYAFIYKWWFILGIFFIALTKVLSVGIIELIKNGVNSVSLEGASQNTITPFVVAIIGCACLLIVVRTISRYLFFTPGRMIEYNIRNEYFTKLQYLQRDFFGEYESGDLVNRCTHDIMFVRSVFGFSSLQIFNVSLAFFFGITAMVRMDLETTIYLLIPMAVSFAIIQVNILLMFRYWRISDKKIGAVSSFCLSSYKGVSVIQGYNSTQVFESKFNDANNEYLKLNLKLAKIRSFVFPLIGLVGSLSILIILWIVGPKVIAKQMTLGEVTAFIGYISMVLPPLMSLGWMLNSLNRAIPAMQRLDEILCKKPNLLPVTENLEYYIPGKEFSLQVRDLCYEYNAKKVEENSTDSTSKENPFSIQNITFELTPGKVLGIVGETGSGKTTIVDSLSRLHQINAGLIYINGKDAAHTDISIYRDYLAIVPQKPFLFSTTLRENLRIATSGENPSNPSDQELLDTLEVAGFSLDLTQLPDGLDTLVGEKGVMLSGGQRQRVALARALLKNAAIYILDDVLSAVDHETEHKIIANLRLFAKEKSFVIVSHRISAVQWADEILVIQNGHIANRGSHDELIQKDGFYKEIYEYQGSKEWNNNTATEN